MKTFFIALFFFFFYVLANAQFEIDESLSGEEIVELYLKAIGGKGKIKKIDNVRIKLYVQVDETPMAAFIHIKNNEKYHIVCKSGEDTVQVHVFDGKQARIFDMEGVRKITGKSLQTLKLRSMMVPEANYKKLKYSVEMLSVEKIDKREAYKVQVQRPDNSIFYQYFDGETGLKLKEEENTLTDDGKELKVTTLFRKYKIVNKVKIPFKKIILTDDYNIYMEILGIDVMSKIPKNKFNIDK